MKVMNTLAF